MQNITRSRYMASSSMRSTRTPMSAASTSSRCFNPLGRRSTTYVLSAAYVHSSSRHYTTNHQTRTNASTSSWDKPQMMSLAAMLGGAVAFAGSMVPSKKKEEETEMKKEEPEMGVPVATLKEATTPAVAAMEAKKEEEEQDTKPATTVPMQQQQQESSASSSSLEDFWGTIKASRFPAASMFTVYADEKQPSPDSNDIDGALAKHTFPMQGRANVYKIVLTGGPCGGKSTALSILSSRLTSLGFHVYSVPEAATLLFSGGGRFTEWDMEKEIAFEENKIRTQMALEDAFMQLARVSGKPSVIICDRGTVDSKAYVSEDAWNLLLNKTGWSIVGLRDKQYDAVLHLISTALGAESFYQTVNNPTRSESIEVAKELDLRVLNAWIGHPRLFIIDNSTDFKGKMDRVMEVLCRQLGIMSSGTVRKFLLLDPKDFDNIPVQYEEFDVEQTFLRSSTASGSEAGYVFIQKRGQYGVNHYRYSTKLMFPDTQEKAVIERQITGLEYLTLLKQADPQRHVVKKKVRCFLWNHRYYELSMFVSPISLPNDPHSVVASRQEPLVVLYTDGPSNEGVKLPPFLRVAEDVTNDRRYSSYTLAFKEADELR